MSVKGRGARDKGSRAERKVRDMLRGIYPKELRQRVQRIPMSGAGYIKGDVADNNDPDTCYEIKNQEHLQLHEWWRQAKSQSGPVRTTSLVVTQAYRPYYFILRRSDWLEMLEHTSLVDLSGKYGEIRPAHIFDDMANLGVRDMGTVELDGDPCVVISSAFYLEVKKDLYSQQSGV